MKPDWYKVWEGRNYFLKAVAEYCPEVLASLRSEVWPLYLSYAVEVVGLTGQLDITWRRLIESPNSPEADSLRQELRRWSLSFNLVELVANEIAPSGWVMTMALATLHTWLCDGLLATEENYRLRKLRFWGLEEEIDVHHRMLLSDWEEELPRSEYQLPVPDPIRETLDAYRRRCWQGCDPEIKRRYELSCSMLKGHAHTVAKHHDFTALALYQCKSLSLRETRQFIARLDSRNIEECSTLRAIDRTAQLLSLHRRAGKVGRPRKY